MSGRDTIFALSSGAAPAGVAVVRMSGPGVRFGLGTLLGSLPAVRKASLRLIKGLDGTPIDQGLVLFFVGPESFTGEDVGELQVHGGRAVLDALLSTLAGLEGFRPAEPGEFSRRAFLNRRLDLTEVEGLADLVMAETEAQRRQALRQSEGGLREIYEAWRGRLIRARAMVEAELDFAEEEDVPGSVAELAWADVSELVGEISRHLEDGRRGERLREGAEIVVLGPPNSGKSSLINTLAGRDMAIVTAEPGTTRDLIEVRLDLGGFPMTVVDTAGMREAAGAVEAEGIRRAGERAGRADLVLWLSDISGGPIEAPPKLGTPVLRLATKLDLIDSLPERSRQAADFDLSISTVTGEGMSELVRRLEEFAARELSPGESPLITRARYRVQLQSCLEALRAAIDGPAGAELRAEELRRATDALGRITGRVDVEDLLDVIFREFCIGK